MKFYYNNAKVAAQIAKDLSDISNKYILKLKYSKKTISNQKLFFQIRDSSFFVYKKRLF